MPEKVRSLCFPEVVMGNIKIQYIQHGSGEGFLTFLGHFYVSQNHFWNVEILEVKWCLTSFSSLFSHTYNLQVLGLQIHYVPIMKRSLQTLAHIFLLELDMFCTLHNSAHKCLCWVSSLTLQRCMQLPWLTEEEGGDGKAEGERCWFGGSVLQQNGLAESQPSQHFILGDQSLR